MVSKTSYLLQKTLDSTIDDKKIFGANFCIKKNNFEWQGAAGNFESDDCFFIASTTKLFITALVLHYKHRGLIELEDHIDIYLEDDIINGLHVYKGTDFSRKICIKKLMAHTSGIADYFQQIDHEGNSLELELISGNDKKWSFYDAILRSKRTDPYFAPNACKAHYSDTNYQLLGKIIENVSGKSLSENIQDIICKPMSMNNTYMYDDVTDSKPKNMFYKNKILSIPQAMSSFTADGGIVSTSRDMMTFLYNFFNGTFFPKKYIAELQVWHKIFFPLKSGVGIQLFRLPKYLDPFDMTPELIGHSGLSGSLAFYNPKHDIYITGTVNQIAYPDLSFRTAIKLIKKLNQLKPHHYLK